MSVFLGLAEQYKSVDSFFAASELAALDADDDEAFYLTLLQRQRNDQAYFLYLFTRFEWAVNQAVLALLGSRNSLAQPWPDRRVWQAWARDGVENIPFLSKAEVLTDKSHRDYQTVLQYYRGRNEIAHGGIWEPLLAVRLVARDMHDVVGRFVTS